MIPNKKHQIFADEYILSSDSIASYQKDIIFKNNKIWYIGKGKKNRVLRHFYKSSNNSINNEIVLKENIITYSILYTTNIEAKAYEIEKELIIGCKRLNIELCNIIYNNGIRENQIYKFINTLKSFSKIAHIPSKGVLSLTDCVNMTLNVIRILAKKPIIIN